MQSPLPVAISRDGDMSGLVTRRCSATTCAAFGFLSLALRSLGLTTVDLRPAGAAGLPGLPNVRGVVTLSGEPWTSQLESKCTELGLRLQSVSLADEAAVGLDASQPMGGHILLTSGTTGTSKMVLMRADRDADLVRLHAGLFGLNQHTVFSIFHYGAWSGLNYKWAISTWSVGGAVSSSNNPGHCCALESPMRC
jgi:hypothetical protein